ncbi:MAG: hypothetical protein ABI359_11060, partial [Ginsengibacter sp.]
MKYRYPGPKPFTEEDEALFFGRKNEKEQLNTIVQNNKLTVLFGRSGYGKSSLIQAAVVPHFKKSAKYKVIEIRFSYSSTKKEEISHLRKQLLDEFKKHIRQTIFLSEVENDKQGRSLWQLFTTIQWEAKQEGFKGILLIMDQFEEIFNFPKAQYDNLSIELADLVYNRIPPYFQETLMTKLDNADFSERNKEQVDFIKDALPTHFLIGIRSDRLYLLDELGEVIPVIFNNRYKLKQILIEQIEDIIEGPAKYKGDFLSVPFSYSPEVIKKISGFFENKEDMLSGQKTIEAFELQIICKYIEEKVILRVTGKKSSVDPDNIEVDNSYLPENLNDIIKNYYIDIVSGENEITKDLGEFERLIIRYLIEEKLIDNKTNSRICLDKVSITPMGFNEGLLDKLTETRIIRRELNTVTGQSYEISHDTLLQPIQDATRSTDLVELKHALNAYYHNILKKANQKSYLLRGHAIEKKFVDNHNNASYFTTNDFIHTQKNDTLIAELEKSKILNSSGVKPKKYILNEAFQDVVSSRVKNFDFSRLRAAMYALIISILVISFVVFLCVRVYNLYERERIQRVAERIVPEQDDYQKGKENLLVLNYVYKHLKDYPQRITTVPANLLKQFNYLYLFADTIAGHNDLDTISNFEVLPGDRIFAFFKNKNLYTGEQLERGILYDKNLHVVDSFRKIYDAQALPGTNEMVILFKDSIRLYGAGLGVKLKNDSNSWITFKPLSLIHKNLLFGIAQTSSTMGSQQYVLVNFNTGSIKLLSGNQNDQIYLKQDESGFIIASDPNIMSVDLDG